METPVKHRLPDTSQGGALSPRGVSRSELNENIKKLTRAMADLAKRQAELGTRLETLHRQRTRRRLDRAEVAQRVGVQVRTLDRIRRLDNGFPEPRFIGKSPRWTIEEIDAYMEKQRNPGV